MFARGGRRLSTVCEMVATMNPIQCLTLSVLQAFTKCDTVSAFAGRRKKTAWETWKSFPEVSDARAICGADVQPNQ